MNLEFNTIIAKFGKPDKAIIDNKKNEIIIFLTYQVDTKDILKYKNEIAFGEISYKYHNAKCTSAYVTYQLRQQQDDVFLPVAYTTSHQ